MDEALIQKFIAAEEKRSEGDYNSEFSKIRNEQDEIRKKRTCKVGSDPMYFSKNRYRDIIPYDDNRVKLSANSSDEILTEDEEEGYINASPIHIPPADAWYIAAQAPLPATLNDWFRMIREQKVAVIVMLCKLVELGRAKCERYWPDTEGKEQKFGETTVKLCSEKQCKEYCQRTLSLRWGSSEEPQVVQQLHYSEWPDHGCPQSEAPLLNMIEVFDELHYKDTSKPVLVHCSAGCGRTGTIIAANVVRELINSKNLTNELNLRDLVIELRRQRVSMVQTTDQYQFLHKLVAHFCRQKLGKSDNSELPSLPNSCDSSAERFLHSSSSPIPEYPEELPQKPLGPEMAVPMAFKEESVITG